jgi:ribonuclease HI
MRGERVSEQVLYADGGVISRNPSPIGGTWAWCLVQTDGDNEGQMRTGSGVIPATEGYGGSVSNNVSELVAAVSALESVPAFWRGTLCSDSQVTLGRLFLGWPLRGVPEPLVKRLRRVQLRLQDDLEHVRSQLLQGHPTKADLERGAGAKRGLPVSQWNVWCDRRCGELAAEYLKLNQPVEVPA